MNDQLRALGLNEREADWLEQQSKGVDLPVGAILKGLVQMAMGEHWVRRALPVSTAETLREWGR